MDSHLLATLAQPNRLFIVELLRNGPRTVNEISNKLKLNQPQTSKHLKVLADAGVVDITPIANQRLYALNPAPFKEIDTWLEKYRYMWDARLDRLEKLLKNQQKLKNK